MEILFCRVKSCCSLRCRGGGWRCRGGGWRCRGALQGLGLVEQTRDERREGGDGRHHRTAPLQRRLRQMWNYVTCF